MPANEIEKALTFIRGVAARDPALATRHLHPVRYREHDPRVADGIVGVREHVAGLPPEHHRLEVVRAFGDDDLVVVQSHGDVLGLGELFDVFRFADGLIAEHWAFGAPSGPPNRSGHTQTDGPAAPDLDHDAETSKSVVRTYYQRVHVGGEHDLIPRYVAAGCIRHEPGVIDGRDAFMSDLKVLIQGRSIDEIRLFMGRGDLVFLAAMGTADGEPCVYVDLYRVDAGQIVERWGFPQTVPRQDASKNRNGML